MSDTHPFDSSPSAAPHSDLPPPRPVYGYPPFTPEPTRSGRGCGFWAGWMLAVIFFFTSGVLLLAFLGLNVSDVVEEETATRPYAEKTVSGSGANKILLLPVTGIISNQPREQGAFRVLPGLVTSIRQQLEQAERDPAIKALLVQVDSPGGGLTDSDVIHEEIKQFKAKTKAKVVACMEDVAASGGYYVCAPADKIYAHPTTITGSIGVIMLHANIEGLLEKIGVVASPIKSGALKDMGSWTRPMTPEEQLLLQTMIAEMYDKFVQVVSAGRTAAGVKMMTPDAVRKVADGRIYTATQAKKLGLVDEIGYLDDAIQAAKKLAKLSNAKVVQYYSTFSILDIFTGQTHQAPRVSLNLETLTLPQPPRLMYLWTGGTMKSQ